jgi:WD40 repeat protein
MLHEEKFVTSHSKGHFTIFDNGMSDIFPERFLPYAHGAPITGISARKSSRKVWTSCSIDKSCLIWDLSQEKPASILLCNYDHQVTGIHWTSQEENHELVMIGDEIGNVLTLDPRKPGSILNKQRMANRPITEFSFNGTRQFGVLSKSNVANIVEISSDGSLTSIHKHHAPGFIYSMCWDVKDLTTFYVVGEEKYAKKIVLA